jgi:plasmid stabilization system protein ParE
MKVKWTATSRKHLKSIHDYIAADSSAYAQRLIDRITRRTEQLKSFPESGGKVLEYDDPSIRELLEGPYRIIYRVRPDRADILAVIHSARLLPEELPPA